VLRVEVLGQRLCSRQQGGKAGRQGLGKAGFIMLCNPAGTRGRRQLKNIL
jgi:hypothetical protein